MLMQLQKENVGKSCNPFATPVVEGDRLSAPRPGLFTPGKLRYPLWASGSFRTGTENIEAIGIRSPDLPARSESLYSLCYPAACLASLPNIMFT